MTIAALRGNRAMLFLAGLAVVSLVGLAFLPPIPQDQAYHGFADRRTLLGIPHFWNVASNLPFILVGAAGLLRFRDPTTLVVFFGIFLTGFGSSYYHWAPDDRTLFWDRLPMTIGFMALLAGAIGERTSARIGVMMLAPLLVLGLFSLLLWRWTGDLRLYAWVQFYPVVALPILYWLFPTTTGSAWLVTAAGIYFLAKLLEHFDAAIDGALGGALSGHTFKHLAAAAACYAILTYFSDRRPLASAA
jgi:hypothetical protein